MLSSEKPAQPKKLVFYVGTNKLNPNETFNDRGLFFKKGDVKWVSDRVFEYLKAKKGFAVVNEVDLEKKMDFNVAKNTLGK